MQAPGRWPKSCAGQPEGCKRRGKHVKPGYCQTLLSAATRKPLFKRPANGQSLALGSPKAAKGAGKGAGKHLKFKVKPGYCLTLLSAATRKPLFKRPADGQSPALDSPKAAKGAGKGAGKHLKPGYCLTLLLKSLENLWASARQMAKVLRGAARRLQKGQGPGSI